MLPFLNRKAQTGVAISHRTPDAPSGEEAHSADHEDAAIEAAASDLIRAIHSKDVKAVADALRNALEIMNAEAPQDESPDMQNEVE